MNAGRADQIGTPSEIYNRPTTRFVASFVGTLNIIEATVIDPAANTVKVGENTIRLRESIGALKGGDKLSIALRPEAGSLLENAKGDTALTGQVLSSHFLGSVIRTKLKVGGNQISFDMFNSPDAVLPQSGETLTLRFNAHDFLIVRD